MRFKKIIAWPWGYFGAIVTVGLVIRLNQISPALLERTPNRQIIDALLVRGLDRRGLANLGMYLYGFPLYHWLVVGGYHVLGTTDAVVGRIVSVIASVLSAYWVWSLFKLYGGKRLAVWGLFFFYLLSPVNIILSRSFLIDELTLALGIGGIYYLSWWQRQKKFRWFWLGSLLLALMTMSKITFGYILLPAVYIIGKKWKYLGLLTGIILVPSLIWYGYARGINEHLNQGTTGWDVLFWFSPANLFTLKFYVNVFYQLAKWAVTPVGLILVVIGLALRQSWKESGVFYLWWLGASLFVLGLNKAAPTHAYYFLAFVVPGSFFAARAVEWLSRILTKASIWLPKKLMGGILIITSLLLLVHEEFWQAYRVHPPHRYIPEVAKLVQQISHPEDVIVASAYGMGGIPYFADRTGFELRLIGLTDEEAMEELENYRQQGADYYIVYDKKELAGKEKFTEYLKSYPLVEEYDKSGSLIYSLRK